MHNISPHEVSHIVAEAEQMMHKNRLQEYIQKFGLPRPVYQSDNEGFDHAPKFRSTVRKEYKSRMKYPNRKEAEQDAAQLALKRMGHNGIINNGQCTILPDLKYCKSILHEYAVKKNLESPKYTTTQQGQLHPVFASTLIFDSKSYTGQVGKSKKEAERLATYVSIQSLLESSSEIHLHQIIMSKVKISNKLHQIVKPGLEGSSKQVIDNPGPSVNICVRDPTVNSGHEKKRSLDGVKLGSKKVARQDVEGTGPFLCYHKCGSW